MIASNEKKKNASLDRRIHSNDDEGCMKALDSPLARHIPRPCNKFRSQGTCSGTPGTLVEPSGAGLEESSSVARAPSLVRRRRLIIVHNASEKKQQNNVAPIMQAKTPWSMIIQKICFMRTSCPNFEYNKGVPIARKRPPKDNRIKVGPR